MNHNNISGIPKILLVANVAKEHVLKFHVPTIKHMSDEGWIVDVACGGKEVIPYCHHQYELPIDRSPFKTNFYKAIRVLRTIICDEHYDIVYCHTTVGGIIARLAAKKARNNGVKVVKFAHGSYFYKGAPLWNWIYYPLYKWMAYMTDAIISITQEDFIFSKRHFSQAEVYYVPGIGIDPSRFIVNNKGQIRAVYRKKLDIPDDAIVLIYVAELIKNKNQIFLLDALQKILTKRDDVFLLLVGPDHTNGAFKRYAQHLGVDENVRFLGWRNDIKELYAASDICTASSIREGLGLNIVEAMACDVPVIATTNSGHRAVIDNGINGILVPLNDNSILVDNIESLANDFKRREVLAHNAKYDISKYYNNNVLATIMSILRKYV